MANGESKQNERNSRKRVEPETPSATLIRARNGSAFARCEECKTSVPVALIDMHNCSLEAKIKMSLGKLCGKLGEKWRSTSEEPYVDKAAELKADYEKAIMELHSARDANDDEIRQPEELCDADA